MAIRTRNTTRERVLGMASEILHGRRETDYGTPLSNFSQTADMWNAYLSRKGDQPISAADVCAMMALLKIARLSHKADWDGALDLVGYGACLAEVAGLERPESDRKGAQSAESSI